MTKAAVEKRIRDVLAVERDTISLSNRLFSPGGLFNQLAKTEADRRKIARSALFKEAQTLLPDLQRKEADEFARAVRQSLGESEQGLVRLERL